MLPISVSHLSHQKRLPTSTFYRARGGYLGKKLGVCYGVERHHCSALWYPTRLSHSSPSQSAPVPAQETPSRNVHWDVHPRRLKPLWCRNCCPVKQQREQQVERSPASKIYLRGQSHQSAANRQRCLSQRRRDSGALRSGWGAHLPASWTRPRRSRSRSPSLAIVGAPEAIN